jgi:hypothetical protein
MKRTIPVAITIFFGIVYLLSDGLPDLTFRAVTYRSHLDLWNNISSAFAVAIAAISLTVVHMRHLRRKDRVIYSATLLIAMYFMIIFGIASGRSAAYMTIFNNTAGVLEGVVLSCVCFYIVSSSYRAFRLRSAEAAVMMAATILVMLSNVAIGDLIHEQVPLIGRWLMAFPNVAAMRAITIGATVGGSAQAIRILFGFERTHLGGE